MAHTWSAVAKSGIPREPPPPHPIMPIEAIKQQQTNPEQPTSATALCLEPQPVQRLLRIGSIDIALDDITHDTQLPLSIPRDPEFWKEQHREYRRRKQAKASDIAIIEELLPAATDQPESKPKPKPINWAALLKPNGAGANTTTAGNAHTVNGAVANSIDNRTIQGRGFGSLEDALTRWKVVFNAPPIWPRGLVNTGNMCFMNVVLQALLYCKPFCNMLWSIKENVAFSFNTSTPLLEALIQYMHEFKHNKGRLSQQQGELEEPFVPENVYEALWKKNVFQTLRGQQEDAQEFMNYLINGIHEEMAGVLQMQHRQKEAEQTPASDSHENSSTGWVEVGPNNRTILMRDGSESTTRTPITQIFGGMLRSTLTMPYPASGHKIRAPQSSSREPFQWLALAISEDVDSVEDGLDQLMAPEVIDGYRSLQGEPVSVTKQTLLEQVPPVLVFHLKRFVFCANEGVQKIGKFVEYPPVLSLSPKWLAKTSAAGARRNSQYRLSGVIYHHGINATGGHYTCDILRSADEWLRFDDVSIECLDSIDDVLEEKDDRTAYILFYCFSQKT
ncbi:cysteine proteinase [Coemansia reversa NRRL 1564]|uniref:Ubiquitin carboxyl-terminal hydrolase n=1 Tax=Coemansia reversa (strain ATCC 12441 / NRRL 1564) TaxID=763665 RepID=A0A2G5BJ32_COERN|nr:cysteine proteinase [Coemansia reversa NRRL 1564]|eukprot:PIA19028.1 cysteine proteinase [Coemansia reversa NRRL 1564]